MDMLKLNFSDMNLLLTAGFVLFFFCITYVMASYNGKRALKKGDAALKQQEKTNQLLGYILSEARRSNQFLADLAGLEPMDYPAYPNEMQETQQMQQMQQTQQNSYAEISHAQSGANNKHKLYVGNIDYTASESELSAYFAKYGHVEFVNIPVNRYTGKARGFGFVTFSSLEDANRAMDLNGTEFKGRQIQVNFAKERDFA